jgi:hypothetical protein
MNDEKDYDVFAGPDDFDLQPLQPGNLPEYALGNIRKGTGEKLLPLWHISPAMS